MKKTTQRAFWALAGLGFLIGLIGLIQRLTQGHEVANYGSYVPWGLWVAAYVWLVGLSGGAFFVATLVYVFKVKRLAPVGKLSLLTALATLLGAMVLVWLDLGHMGRFWRLFAKTQFTSMMGWMAWFYLVYFVLVAVMLWFALRADLVACSDAPGLRGRLCRFLTFGRGAGSADADAAMLRTLGAIGIPLVIGFSGAEGSLFGVVGARPFWHGGLTPIVFLAGALVSGTALVAFVTALWGSKAEDLRPATKLLAQLTLGLLVFDLLLEWAEFSTGLFSSVPSLTESLDLILFGPYWWAFWIVHLLVGSVVPLLLLALRPNRVATVGIAGGLIAGTFIAVRLNIVLPGLSVEELEGLREAFTGPGLSFDYFPSMAEWLVFIWAVSLAGIVFLAAYQLLPIVREKEVV